MRDTPYYADYLSFSFFPLALGRDPSDPRHLKQYSQYSLQHHTTPQQSVITHRQLVYGISAAAATTSHAETVEQLRVLSGVGEKKKEDDNRPSSRAADSHPSPSGFSLSFSSHLPRNSVTGEWTN